MAIVRRVLTAFANTESAIIVATSFSVVTLIMVVVIARHVLSRSVMGLEEIALLLAMYLYYVGAARASKVHRQITVRILFLFPLPTPIRKVIDTIVSFLCFGVATYFAYHMTAYCLWLAGPGHAMLYEPIFEWPLYAVTSALVVGLVLTSLYTLTQFVQKVRGYGYEYDRA